MTATTEKSLIISDPLMREALEAEAKSVGVTLDEYVDRFLAAFYKEPERFYKIITPFTD